MARPSEKACEYIKRIEAMSWPELAVLWEAIKIGEVAGWEEGKAFEHLVMRGFALSGLAIEYPYDVPPGGSPIEQIDGLVILGCHTFLVECKDSDKVDIEAIAKLRNQLLRRPKTTFGCVFTTGAFTAPALIITDFSVPHRILLWSGFDVQECVSKKDFKKTLQDKYGHLCKYGLTDHSPYYEELEVRG
jgi:hypothetical protein